MDEAWKVCCSDEEFADDEGFYQPSDTNEIIRLYEVIQKGEIPKFQTTIYPRREPMKEIENTKAESEELKDDVESAEQEKEKVGSEDETFDFDSQQDEDVKRYTPRRTPNRPQTKKVGRMENVYSNLMKYKKLEEQQQQKGEKEPQPN